MHWSSSSIANASTASREKRSPKSTPRSSSSRLTGCSASASTSWSRSMREVRKASGRVAGEHVGEGGLVVGPRLQGDLAGRGGGVEGVDDALEGRDLLVGAVGAEGDLARLLRRLAGLPVARRPGRLGRRARRPPVQAAVVSATVRAVDEAGRCGGRKGRDTGQTLSGQPTPGLDDGSEDRLVQRGSLPSYAVALEADQPVEAHLARAGPGSPTRPCRRPSSAGPSGPRPRRRGRGPGC